MVDYRGNLFEEPTVSAAAREAAQASHAKAMHKQAVKAVKQADLGALRSFLQLNQQILLNESVRDSLDGQNAKLKSSTTHLTNPLLLHDCSTTYGEFTLGRFVNVLIAYFEHRLSHVSWPRFHGFLDIGSGTGGPVIVVSHLAQLLRIRHCKGVEIGRYRYDASLGRAQQAADRQLLAAPTEFVYSYAEELTYRFLADVQFFYSFDWAMKAFRGGILQHMVRMKWFGVDVDEEIEQPSMPRRAQVESLYYATCMPLREMRSELKESGTGYKPSLVFKQLMKLAGSKNTPTLYLYYLEGVPS